MKIEITCITPVLRAFLYFFPYIISFQHVFHLGVGRRQIEWKLKVKFQFSHRVKIGQNDHSYPYIESTTVLSDCYCEIIKRLKNDAVQYKTLKCLTVIPSQGRARNPSSETPYTDIVFPSSACTRMALSL